jgi:hypothetical protein
MVKRPTELIFRQNKTFVDSWKRKDYGKSESEVRVKTGFIHKYCHVLVTKNEALIRNYVYSTLITRNYK